MRYFLALLQNTLPLALLLVSVCYAYSSGSSRNGWLSMSSGSKQALTLKSPCKLNLFLRIMGRRPNGYLSLHDTLHMEPLPSGTQSDHMTCSDSSLSIDSSNLVIKALDLMRRRTGRADLFFRVHLDKVVPMQAGLGGGSSNAATAMFAFNHFTGYSSSSTQLLDWSGEIGSDISFFFSGGTAYCTGRGEVVHNQPSLPDKDAVTVHVFKPSEGLSTASVFKTLDLSQLSDRDPAQLLGGFNAAGLTAQDMLVNDLERPAFQLCPLLGNLKQALLDLPQECRVRGAMMSGSGTSVFALTDKHAPLPLPVVQILQQFPGTKYFQCSYVNRPNDVRIWYD